MWGGIFSHDCVSKPPNHKKYRPRHFSDVVLVVLLQLKSYKIEKNGIKWWFFSNFVDFRSGCYSNIFNCFIKFNRIRSIFKEEVYQIFISKMSFKFIITNIVHHALSNHVFLNVDRMGSLYLRFMARALLIAHKKDGRTIITWYN